MFAVRIQKLLRLKLIFLEIWILGYIVWTNKKVLFTQLKKKQTLRLIFSKIKRCSTQNPNAVDA